MKSRFIAVILCTSVFAVPLCSCEQNESTEPKQSIVSSVTAEEGTFDIETIRTNINIQGYKFELPQKLSELEKGLEYKFTEDYTFGNEDAIYGVEISDKEKLVLNSVAYTENSKKKTAYLPNIFIDESNSDIDGVTPLVTTQDEILKKYGEPDNKEFHYFREKGEREIYTYGYKEETEHIWEENKGKFMTIVFDDKNVVASVALTYLE